ncbi:MAG: hypothetical protein ACOYNR_12785 [Blastocatellia bacterium]
MWAGRPCIGNTSQTSIKNAYFNHAATTYTDLFLTLGDNACDVVLHPESQTALLKIYPTILRQSFLSWISTLVGGEKITP